MGLTTKDPEPKIVFVQPSYSFFFERAEHLLDAILPSKPSELVSDCIMQVQQESLHITRETLRKAVALPELQHRVRPAQFLQAELVESLERIAVRLPKHPDLPIH